MSNYDPFRLYDYKQKKSHKGQVLRKKFVGHPLPTVLTPEQLKEAKEILEGIGYYVSKTPINPGRYDETQYRSFIYCEQLDNYVFNNGNHIMHLSDVWNSKILDFQDLFVPSDRVNSFSFEINVISYNLRGYFTSSITTNQNYMNFTFYNDASNNEIHIYPHTSGRFGGISYFASDATHVVTDGAIYYPGLAGNYNTWYQIVSDRNYLSPFLYHYFDNSIETYNSIVTSDFTNYNPILMHIGVTVPDAIAGTTFSVSSLYVTYQITMTINTDI